MVSRNLSEKLRSGIVGTVEAAQGAQRADRTHLLAELALKGLDPGVDALVCLDMAFLREGLRIKECWSVKKMLTVL